MMPLSRSIPVFTWNRGCQFFTVISFFSPPNVPRGGEKKGRSLFDAYLAACAKNVSVKKEFSKESQGIESLVSPLDVIIPSLLLPMSLVVKDSFRARKFLE